MAGQTTWLRAQRPLPGARVRLGRAVRASPTMARNLPTYRRGRAPQAGRDAANRSTRSHPARNLFALIQYQRYGTALAGDRGDSPIRPQDMMNPALGPPPDHAPIPRPLPTFP